MWATRLKEKFEGPRELERAQRILGEDTRLGAPKAANESGAGDSGLGELDPGELGSGELDGGSAQFVFGPGFLQALFREAGFTYRQRRNLYLRFCLSALISILLMVALRNPLPLLFMLSVSVAEYVRLKNRIRLRAVQFEKDYTAFLLSLASAIRTGLDPLVAVIQSDQLFMDGSEVRKELERFKAHIDRGMSEEDAILKFAESINHPDIQLFRTAFILARREGSSLSLCLQRLARVTRQRQSFRRKMRSAVAMQKLSSIGIAGCAIVVGIFQSLTNPTAIREAFHHPLGIKFLSIGLFLMVLGLGWMMRMTRSRI